MDTVRAALYIRVSTDEQTEYSPAAQQKALTDYARRNNMRIPPEFIFSDEGYSGRRADKRPAFMRMIGNAKAKPRLFDVILVHKFDRFARSREDSIVYKSMLRRQCGIRVISITESLDEEDKMSGLIEAILEAMAEYYSINLSDEVKKGMTEKARQGGFQTSPPLGYAAGPVGGIQIIESEAEFVRHIFTQFAEKKAGTYQIARRLAQLGAKSKRGNPIDARHVEYILRNPVYIGKLRWTPNGRAKRGAENPDTIIADGGHAPIVSEELFQKAAARLEQVKKASKPRERPLDECRHWLSGLLRCSDCGASLTLSGESFQCRRYSAAVCGVSHSIRVSKLEQAFTEELKRALEGCAASLFQPAPTAADPGGEKIALEKRLARVIEQMNRANDAYLAGIYTLDEFKSVRQELEQAKSEVAGELEALSRGLETADADTPGKLPTVTELLASGCGLRAKQRALRRIIERVVFDRVNNRLEVYYREP